MHQCMHASHYKILLLFACIKKQQNFPFRLWTIVHGGQKIESNRNYYYYCCFHFSYSKEEEN